MAGRVRRCEDGTELAGVVFQSMALVNALRDAGIGVESLSVEKPTLDEVFLALTGEDAHDDFSDDKGAA